MNDEQETLLSLTRELLQAMFARDAEAYKTRCVSDMSAWEWYIAPYRVDGVEFHLTLIEGGGNGAPSRIDLLTPRVQMYGDAAIVTYTLLKTTLTETQPPEFARVNETRVFVKQDGAWKMAHLHKSPAA